jgi:hypothetical protein
MRTSYHLLNRSSKENLKFLWKYGLDDNGLFLLYKPNQQYKKQELVAIVDYSDIGYDYRSLYRGIRNASHNDIDITKFDLYRYYMNILCN